LVGLTDDFAAAASLLGIDRRRRLTTTRAGCVVACGHVGAGVFSRGICGGGGLGLVFFLLRFVADEADRPAIDDGVVALQRDAELLTERRATVRLLDRDHVFAGLEAAVATDREVEVCAFEKLASAVRKADHLIDVDQRLIDETFLVEDGFVTALVGVRALVKHDLLEAEQHRDILLLGHAAVVDLELELPLAFDLFEDGRRRGHRAAGKGRA